MDVLFCLGDMGVVGSISCCNMSVGCISTRDRERTGIDWDVERDIQDGSKFLFGEDKAEVTVFTSSSVGGDGHFISNEFGAEALECESCRLTDDGG